MIWLEVSPDPSIDVVGIEIGGVAEIAELLDVSPRTVTKWRSRDVGFPEPDGELASGPLWTRETVLTWARQTGRVDLDRT